MKNLKLFPILVLLFFANCKKKIVEANLTRTQMVARTWVCEKAEVVGAQKQTIYQKGASGNLLELKDSFVAFTTDGKYTGIDFNAVPQTGSWKFKNNETVAELDSWDYDFNIVNLSKTNLDFNTQVDFNDNTYDIFVKMVPK